MPRWGLSLYQNCRSQWEGRGGDDILGTETSFLGHHFSSSLGLSYSFLHSPLLLLSLSLLSSFIWLQGAWERRGQSQAPFV